MQPIPDKNAIFPNENIKEICFVKNTITRKNIIVGDYTYFDDKNGADKFETHVTHHYDFIGDRLIIGNFCQIAAGIEFIMNGANHCTKYFTTYPFYIMGASWKRSTPSISDLQLKGDTIVGNDVWFGQNVTVMPGVHIGNGAIIGANSVVANDISAYSIAVGNPCRAIKKRFNDDVISTLETLKWWNWSAEKITANLDALCSCDIEKLKKLL